MFKKAIVLITLSSLLTGCMYGGPKQTAGQLVGAATGALIGSQMGHGRGKLVGVAMGTLAGSYLGGMIGHKMDQRDRQLAEMAMMDTLERAPDHEVRSWRNPNNNHQGKFKVTKTHESPKDQRVYREYVHTVIIDGRQETVHGRAYRDPRTGQWIAQN